jgi:uncharacterized iron-regulated membrane protein
MNQPQTIARYTRFYRKVHHYIGMFLFAFFFLISLTGLLLGWKKHSGGLILPATEKGTSVKLSEWLSYDSLNGIAARALRDSLPGMSPELDRIDARPDKGIVKFVFKDHYTEIQVDAATGRVLALNRRTSDIIEQIHDGSILDFAFSTGSGQIKLGYTSVTGLSLLLLTVTGFFLWYDPIRIRRSKRRNPAL